MIVSVLVRRLKEGFTFEDFVEEWEADQGFGVPTRVFNAQSLDDPRDVISIGFVAVTVDELKQRLSASAAPESVTIGSPPSLSQRSCNACTRSGPNTTSPWNLPRSDSVQR